MCFRAALIAACFAGCGDSKETKADTIKIGGIGPITGGAAVYGQAVKNAAEMAVEEINAAGGINGTMLEFNFQDDEHGIPKNRSTLTITLKTGVCRLLWAPSPPLPALPL